MDAFVAAFFVVFLAEMGDKTQFVVMAFAAKYDWKRVLAGMTIGILIVHSLAVAVGSILGRWMPEQLMAFLAALLFLGFGIWTLRAKDDEGEDAGDSSYGPVLSVAIAFILGEMGDKTQFATMAMATQYDAWLYVLLGAVSGMLLADCMGLILGALLHRKLPAKTMRCLSGGIFLLFGVFGLVQAGIKFLA